MSDGLPSNIIDARTRAEQAEQYAGQLSAGVPTVGDVLKERVNKLFNENQDVFAGFNQSVGNLVAAPGTSYGTTENIKDPFARERLASIDLATAYQPAVAYGSLLGQRMGNIADIVQSGANAYTAQATAAQAAAQIQRQSYQDILNEFLQAQQLEMQRQQLAASRASAAQITAGKQQSEDIKQLIANARTLPAGERAAYISASGYDPSRYEFADLFSPETLAAERKAREVLKGKPLEVPEVKPSNLQKALLWLGF
jgi:hypothetical protein